MLRAGSVENRTSIPMTTDRNNTLSSIKDVCFPASRRIGTFILGVANRKRDNRSTAKIFAPRAALRRQHISVKPSLLFIFHCSLIGGGWMPPVWASSPKFSCKPRGRQSRHLTSKQLSSAVLWLSSYSATVCGGKLACFYIWMNYAKKLTTLELYSLETGKERGHLLQGFKTVKLLVEVRSHRGAVFQLRFNETLRGNGEEIVRYHVSTSLRSKSSTILAVNDWNKLQVERVELEQVVNSIGGLTVYAYLCLGGTACKLKGGGWC